MHNSISREDGDATAASCLMQDFCDAWRHANHLTDVDYWLVDITKYHCPYYEVRGGEEEGPHLRHCYKRGADGWQWVKSTYFQEPLWNEHEEK